MKFIVYVVGDCVPVMHLCALMSLAVCLHKYIFVHKFVHVERHTKLHTSLI